MCIGNTRYCANLTLAEQRAQHNFEERKGPYPSELAKRLEEAGIMTAAEHLTRSVAARNERTEQRFRWGDRMSEETAYIEGRRASLPPVDEYLTPVNQAIVLRELTRGREAHFVRAFNSGNIARALEFSDAFEMIARGIRGDLRGFNTRLFERSLSVLRTAPVNHPVITLSLKMLQQLRSQRRSAANQTNREFENAGVSLPKFIVDSLRPELKVEYECIMSAMATICAISRGRRRNRAKRSVLLTALRKRASTFLAQALNDAHLRSLVMDALEANKESLEATAFVRERLVAA